MESNDFKRELQTATGCVPFIGIRISRRSIILDNTNTLSCRCKVEYEVNQQRKNIIVIIAVVVVFAGNFLCSR